MADFKVFAQAVHMRVLALSQGELYTVGHDNRVFEDVYLKAFPEGTNPVYKTNTEHDCTCCKQFIRNFGRVVGLMNGKIVTVWGGHALPEPYKTVADAMDKFVRDQPIIGVFRTKETQYGAEQTKQLLESGQVINWNHFHGKVAKRHHSATPDVEIGKYNAAVQVFQRGLEELSAEALVQVQSLIENKCLYRGEEHERAVNAFAALHYRFSQLALSADRQVFIWEHAANPASRFRNTVIGTLVQDLSEFKDMEQAVRSFEQKVAPTNYKRPTALITPAMVKQAMAVIEELDMGLSLQRRHARMSDISVNNVLWVDNQAKAQMKSPLENLLMAAAKPKAKFEIAASDISMDAFLMSIMPGATAIDLLVKSTHSSNFVSLTAPVHQGEPRLFKWANDFAWSYDGNITDSIKEKVKNAGGNVTNAKLRVSLAWSNYDDLDLHVYEPDGKHVYFGNKDGKLDVDMNAGGGRSRTPVENVSYVSLKDGKYRVAVNQYNQRETSDVGFVIEVESGGKITQLSYAQAVKGTVEACWLTIKNGLVVELEPGKGLIGGGLALEKWGVTTEQFVRVQTVLNSPNHWDGQQIGNKHWFFVLEGCKNPDPVRGIYNEFLSPVLEVHRKVFEVLGDKAKCPPADEQLSGLGFSSTKGDTVTVRVAYDKGTRVFNVTI